MKKVILSMLTVAILITVNAQAQMTQGKFKSLLCTGDIITGSNNSGYFAENTEKAISQNAKETHEVEDDEVVFKFNGKGDNESFTATVLADNEGILTGRREICLKGMEIIRENGKEFVTIDFLEQKVKTEITNVYFSEKAYPILKLVDFVYTVPKDREYRIGSMHTLKIPSEIIENTESKKIDITEKEYWDVSYNYANNFGHQDDDKIIYEKKIWFNDLTNLYIIDAKKTFGIAREGSTVSYENTIFAMFKEKNPLEDEYSSILNFITLFYLNWK